MYELETKRMFGGLALIHQCVAFAKIKHDKVWLKVNENNLADFEKFKLNQYKYAKDNSLKLNFYETPIKIVENKDQLKDWDHKLIDIAVKK